MPIILPEVKAAGFGMIASQSGRRMADERNRSLSVRRAIEVLSAIALARDTGSSPNITDIAEATSINRSTISRLLEPLIESRLVEQDAETGRYRLGPQTARLGQIYLAQFDVQDVAGPILRELVDQSHETAHLGVMDESEIVYIDKVESPHSIRTVSRIGSRQPLYATSMGKALLAYAEPSVVEAVIGNGMRKRTENTITSPDAFRHELEVTRSRGYAFDDQENERDIRCIGAPVFDHRGQAIAAISISGPTTRVTPEHIDELSALVCDAAERISVRLGAPERR